MDNLSSYEQEQLGEIKKWKAEEPGVISQAFGVAMEPMAWLIRKVVPQSAIRAVLDFANSTAEWLTDTSDIKRDGEVQQITDLRYKDLKLSDKLANEVHNWAIGIAVAEGAATGAGGIFTTPVDIPAIITIALRTIHKIGLCYGHECVSKENKDFVLAIMAASGANSMEEKAASLSVLRSLEVILIKQTWKSMTEKTAQQQLSKEAAIIGLRNLAKQLGINITKRRALASIPIIGAFIGGSVNGWYIKEVGWAARRAFQERWLIENDKLVDL
jgi:hypothetical protein